MTKETMRVETGRHDRGDGIHLAWARTPGRHPTTVFLPGFRSDMTGAKALAIQSWCLAQGTACLRLDYAGHGASDGAFTDGTIGSWTQDALLLIDRLTEGPLLLVGSSMGGWIALLLARARPARVAGLIGIAAAPDFTESLMWESMMPAERATLERDGVLLTPSQYGDPTPVTLKLIEEGRSHLLMHAPIDITCPVRLLQGQNDPDVPWETALRLAERLASADVEVTLVKDGDHRLSRPSDLAVLRRLHSELSAAMENADRIIGLYQRHAHQFAEDRNTSLFERGWLDPFLALVQPGGQVLDIGCGVAEPLAGHIVRQGHRVTGIDSAPAMIEICRTRLPAEEWLVADMRQLSLGRRFAGILAWDSFFFLRQDDQRAMFPIFAAHADPGAPLLFTSGPAEGVAIGVYQDEPLFHASLDPAEYRELLANNGFRVVRHIAEDPACSHHTVWLAQRGPTP